MRVQINVKTPRNQAASCIETQKDALIGVVKRKDIVEQKVLSDHEFYWILKVKDRKEVEWTIKRCAMGETMIKKFYRALFKIIGRANALANKFQKGTDWIRRWIKKKLDKMSKDNQGMKNHIDSMTDEQFKDWLKITDREPMEKLLSGSLIEVKIIEDPDDPQEVT